MRLARSLATLYLRQFALKSAPEQVHSMQLTRKKIVGSGESGKRRANGGNRVLEELEPADRQRRGGGVLDRYSCCLHKRKRRPVMQDKDLRCIHRTAMHGFSSWSGWTPPSGTHGRKGTCSLMLILPVSSFCATCGTAAWSCRPDSRSQMLT